MMKRTLVVAVLLIVAAVQTGCGTPQTSSRQQTVSITLYPAETAADRHFWASVIVFCVEPSALACAKAEVFPSGLGFTVLGEAQDALIKTTYSLIRLDNGGRLTYAMGTMESEARQWTRERKCAGEPRIGMSEREAIEAWCNPEHINTTETRAGTHEPR